MSTYIKYTGDGATTNFVVPFFDEVFSEIEVYVDEILQTIDVDYTFLSENTIQFVTAPALDTKVEVMRVTNINERLVDYQNGSILNESELDKDSNQLFYLIQDLKGDTDKKITDISEQISGLDLETNIFKETFTATEGQTVFTLTEGEYTVDGNNVDVYINGVYQNKNTYTETDSSTITLTEGVSLGDKIEIVYGMISDSVTVYAVDWSNVLNKPSVKTDSNLNSSLGVNALNSGLGSSNVAVGKDSMLNNEGSANVAVGVDSMKTNVTGNTNTAVGKDSMSYNTSGSANVAFGATALYSNTTGNFNTAIGQSSLRYTITGSDNVDYSICTGVGFDTRVSGSFQVQLGGSGTTTYAYGAIQDRSDKRDKLDIKDTPLGLDFINKLRPVEYRFNHRERYIETNENGEKVIKFNDGSRAGKRFHQGLIAQEVKSVIDESGIDFGGFQDHSINGGDDVLSLGYNEFISPMIKSIQELSNKVKELEDKINILENK